MKYIFCVITSFLCLSNTYSQSSLPIKKLEKAFATANTVKDFKALIDGDVVSSICSLLGGGPVCELLSVKQLNEDEEAEIKGIKTKFEFEYFLKNKGIKPEDFYLKLWLNKNNETIVDRLAFLKKKDN